MSGLPAPPPLQVLAAVDQGVVVNKPAGRLVHNSAWAGPKEHSVSEQLADQLGHPVFPVHRLDRGTSGALLFAFGPEAVAHWQAALARVNADKRYLAVVRGRNLAPGRLEHAVRRDKGSKERVEAVSEVIAAWPSLVDRCALAEVRVLTGRWHQVRQHLDHLNHPVLGDADHGDTRENRRYRQQHGLVGLALHAVELRCATEHETLCVRAPLPPVLAALVERLGLNAAPGLVERFGSPS